MRPSGPDKKQREAMREQVEQQQQATPSDVDQLLWQHRGDEWQQENVLDRQKPQQQKWEEMQWNGMQEELRGGRKGGEGGSTATQLSPLLQPQQPQSSLSAVNISRVSALRELQKRNCIPSFRSLSPYPFPYLNAIASAAAVRQQQRNRASAAGGKRKEKGRGETRSSLETIASQQESTAGICCPAVAAAAVSASRGVGSAAWEKSYVGRRCHADRVDTAAEAAADSPAAAEGSASFKGRGGARKGDAAAAARVHTLQATDSVAAAAAAADTPPRGKSLCAAGKEGTTADAGAVPARVSAPGAAGAASPAAAGAATAEEAALGGSAWINTSHATEAVRKGESPLGGREETEEPSEQNIECKDSRSRGDHGGRGLLSRFSFFRASSRGAIATTTTWFTALLAGVGTAAVTNKDESVGVAAEFPLATAAEVDTHKPRQNLHRGKERSCTKGGRTGETLTVRRKIDRVRSNRRGSIRSYSSSRSCNSGRRIYCMRSEKTRRFWRSCGEETENSSSGTEEGQIIYRKDNVQKNVSAAAAAGRAEDSTRCRNSRQVMVGQQPCKRRAFDILQQQNEGHKKVKENTAVIEGHQQQQKERTVKEEQQQQTAVRQRQQQQQQQLPPEQQRKKVFSLTNQTRVGVDEKYGSQQQQKKKGKDAPKKVEEDDWSRCMDGKGLSAVSAAARKGEREEMSLSSSHEAQATCACEHKKESPILHSSIRQCVMVWPGYKVYCGTVFASVARHGCGFTLYGSPGNYDVVTIDDATIAAGGAAANAAAGNRRAAAIAARAEVLRRATFARGSSRLTFRNDWSAEKLLAGLAGIKRLPRLYVHRIPDFETPQDTSFWWHQQPHHLQPPYDTEAASHAHATAETANREGRSAASLLTAQATAGRRARQTKKADANERGDEAAGLEAARETEEDADEKGRGDEVAAAKAAARHKEATEGCITKAAAPAASYLHQQQVAASGASKEDGRKETAETVQSKGGGGGRREGAGSGEAATAAASEEYTAKTAEEREAHCVKRIAQPQISSQKRDDHGAAATAAASRTGHATADTGREKETAEVLLMEKSRYVSQPQICISDGSVNEAAAVDPCCCTHSCGMYIPQQRSAEDPLLSKSDVHQHSCIFPSPSFSSSFSSSSRNNQYCTDSNNSKLYTPHAAPAADAAAATTVDAANTATAAAAPDAAALAAAAATAPSIATGKHPASAATVTLAPADIAEPAAAGGAALAAAATAAATTARPSPAGATAEPAAGSSASLHGAFETVYEAAKVSDEERVPFEKAADSVATGDDDSDAGEAHDNVATYIETDSESDSATTAREEVKDEEEENEERTILARGLSGSEEDESIICGGACGYWNLDKRVGWGVAVQGSGRSLVKYEGLWKDDYKEGWGIQTLSHCVRYAGGFKYGLQHGKSLLLYPTGTLFAAEWRSGVLLHQQLLFDSYSHSQQQKTKRKEQGIHAARFHVQPRQGGHKTTDSAATAAATAAAAGETRAAGGAARAATATATAAASAAAGTRARSLQTVPAVPTATRAGVAELASTIVTAAGAIAADRTSVSCPSAWNVTAGLQQEKVQTLLQQVSTKNIVNKNTVYVAAASDDKVPMPLEEKERSNSGKKGKGRTCQEEGISEENVAAESKKRKGATEQTNIQARPRRPTGDIAAAEEDEGKGEEEEQEGQEEEQEEGAPKAYTRARTAEEHIVELEKAVPAIGIKAGEEDNAETTEASEKKEEGVLVVGTGVREENDEGKETHVVVTGDGEEDSKERERLPVVVRTSTIRSTSLVGSKGEEGGGEGKKKADVRPRSGTGYTGFFFDKRFRNEEKEKKGMTRKTESRQHRIIDLSAERRNIAVNMNEDNSGDGYQKHENHLGGRNEETTSGMKDTKKALICKSEITGQILREGTKDPGFLLVERAALGGKDGLGSAGDTVSAARTEAVGVETPPARARGDDAATLAAAAETEDVTGGAAQENVGAGERAIMRHTQDATQQGEKKTEYYVDVGRRERDKEELQQHQETVRFLSSASACDTWDEEQTQHLLLWAAIPKRVRLLLQQQAVDGAALLTATEDDLVDMNIKQWVDRRMLLLLVELLLKLQHRQKQRLSHSSQHLQKQALLLSVVNIPASELHLEARIGEGGYSRVYRARWKYTRSLELNQQQQLFDQQPHSSQQQHMQQQHLQQQRTQQQDVQQQCMQQQQHILQQYVQQYTQQQHMKQQHMQQQYMQQQHTQQQMYLLQHQHDQVKRECLSSMLFPVEEHVQRYESAQQEQCQHQQAEERQTTEQHTEQQQAREHQTQQRQTTVHGTHQQQTQKQGTLQQQRPPSLVEERQVWAGSKRNNVDDAATAKMPSIVASVAPGAEVVDFSSAAVRYGAGEGSSAGRISRPAVSMSAGILYPCERDERPRAEKMFFHGWRPRLGLRRHSRQKGLRSLRSIATTMRPQQKQQLQEQQHGAYSPATSSCPDTTMSCHIAAAPHAFSGAQQEFPVDFRAIEQARPRFFAASVGVATDNDGTAATDKRGKPAADSGGGTTQRLRETMGVLRENVNDNVSPETRQDLFLLAKSPCFMEAQKSHAHQVSVWQGEAADHAPKTPYYHIPEDPSFHWRPHTVLKNDACGEKPKPEAATDAPEGGADTQACGAYTPGGDLDIRRGDAHARRGDANDRGRGADDWGGGSHSREGEGIEGNCAVHFQGGGADAPGGTAACEDPADDWEGGAGAPRGDIDDRRRGVVSRRRSADARERCTDTRGGYTEAPRITAVDCGGGAPDAWRDATDAWHEVSVDARGETADMWRGGGDTRGGVFAHWDSVKRRNRAEDRSRSLSWREAADWGVHGRHHWKSYVFGWGKTRENSFSSRQFSHRRNHALNRFWCHKNNKKSSNSSSSSLWSTVLRIRRRRNCDRKRRGEVEGEILVAVKVFRQRQQRALQRNFYSELAVLSRLAHPNITMLLGAISAPVYGLVTEYVACGSLFDLLHTPHVLQQQIVQTQGTKKQLYMEEEFNKRGVELSLMQSVRLARDICLGMAYLHQQGVLHCDLKSPNVLLTAKGEVKLCDFGLATIVETLQDARPADHSQGKDKYNKHCMKESWGNRKRHARDGIDAQMVREECHVENEESRTPGQYCSKNCVNSSDASSENGNSGEGHSGYRYTMEAGSKEECISEDDFSRTDGRSMNCSSSKCRQSWDSRSRNCVSRDDRRNKGSNTDHSSKASISRDNRSNTGNRREYNSRNFKSRDNSSNRGNSRENGSTKLRSRACKSSGCESRIDCESRGCNSRDYNSRDSSSIDSSIIAAEMISESSRDKRSPPTSGKRRERDGTNSRTRCTDGFEEKNIMKRHWLAEKSAAGTITRDYNVHNQSALQRYSRSSSNSRTCRKRMHSESTKCRDIAEKIRDKSHEACSRDCERPQQSKDSNSSVMPPAREQTDESHSREKESSRSIWGTLETKHSYGRSEEKGDKVFIPAADDSKKKDAQDPSILRFTQSPVHWAEIPEVQTRQQQQHGKGQQQHQQVTQPQGDIGPVESRERWKKSNKDHAGQSSGGTREKTDGRRLFNRRSRIVEIPGAVKLEPAHLGCVGTHHWMAPEGMTSPAHLIIAVGYGGAQLDTSHAPPPLRYIISRCLDYNPKKRPSFSWCAEQLHALYAANVLDVEMNLNMLLGLGQ